MGFGSCELAPSPKSQFHAVGFPVLLSVKLTSSGAFPEVTLLVKSAVGGKGPGELEGFARGR
ncbi:hypothetical protein SDC9_208880 [bioreactor metagenome]|uniref:Uncharacterized protein n=1 Tax=bioreactor metagenome TaxID=1076179 RepID=A0A645JCI0_9ZZZZ